MAKVVFSISSDAATQTLFVLLKDAPDEGDFVKLKKKEGVRVGSKELDSGKHVVLLTLKAGAPGSEWEMTIQRENKPEIKTTGKLNAKGDGGHVGQLTVA